MTRNAAKHEALLDELLKDYTDPQDILGEHGLLKQRTRRVIERALTAELTEHLGYAPHTRQDRDENNSRNGKGKKTVHTEPGSFAIEVPRDRDGSFEPPLVKKRQRRLDGFDDKVLALYARGLSTREIQAHLEELYGVEVSPTLISAITDADLQAIYGAATPTESEQALERFAERWDAKYPAISPSWLADWDRLTVFFDYPPAIRRAIYTTNAIESLHYSLRKVLKGRGPSPTMRPS